jgi:flagellin-like protein
MISKKGLSTIVTTLILVLLVLVAVGILWNPIKKLLTDNEESFEKTKCFDVSIDTSIVNTSAVNYDVTITRNSDGNEDEVMYMKIVLSNDTESSTVRTGTNAWNILETHTESITGAPLEANLIQVTPFFLDEDTGKELICSTEEKEFVIN